jgi:hypothetical protein
VIMIQDTNTPCGQDAEVCKCYSRWYTYIPLGFLAFTKPDLEEMIKCSDIFELDGCSTYKVCWMKDMSKKNILRLASYIFFSFFKHFQTVSFWISRITFAVANVIGQWCVLLLIVVLLPTIKPTIALYFLSMSCLRNKVQLLV